MHQDKKKKTHTYIYIALVYKYICKVDAAYYGYIYKFEKRALPASVVVFRRGSSLYMPPVCLSLKDRYGLLVVSPRG